MRLVADIETNGLLQSVSRFWCAVAIDRDSRKVYKFRPHQMSEFIDLIESATSVAFHNGIKYDHPALEKLSGRKVRRDNIIDTLVLSRLIFPNIGDKDTVLTRRYRKYEQLQGDLQHWQSMETDGYQQNKLKDIAWHLNTLEGKQMLPPKLFGAHSLKAWGYRLNRLKGDFAEQTDWQTYSEDMLDYCEQDVWVTLDLLELIDSKNYSERAIQLEHQICWVMAQQERNGFFFDVEKAERLEMELRLQQVQIERELKDIFGCWYQFTALKKPKKTICYKDPYMPDRTADAPFCEVKYVEFNPGSRQHIAKRLKDLYNWVPTVFTDGGQPKIDEEVLGDLPYPEAKALTRYFMVVKRLSQLADGEQAWTKCVTPEGFIHGSVNTGGAATGRATHSRPNVAQVPSGKVEYGPQCRELFTVPPGWKLFGSDASGLELRCLGHFMATFDGGAYIRELLEGDIHTANQMAAGLATRDLAKTFIYAFLYGAGDELIGAIVCPEGTPEEKVKAGRKIKRKFLDNTPAIRNLRDAVKAAAERGHLFGLDGRLIYVRSAHAALNFLLQGAGALVCKKWVVEIDRLMQERGFKHGWDGDYAFCAWVHDEVQIAFRGEHVAKALGEVVKEAIKITEEYFTFRCPLDCEFAVGDSWKETH
ncbi:MULTISPECIES: DNA polymerase [unclassified Marinobacter]|uniref:DNA polymerase n=1 Tax=unclassified Marinobacter TaxID=83889 RepID=UPI0012697FF8|nr:MULTISPECIES: DNA polymerase [unclassified Marinobacter]QFS87600.1 DNA polymerase I [Marinobacter sp. THAF197a]QFT51385.1 DNA polymerase I [Marinobacter sp. THAF39]